MKIDIRPPHINGKTPDEKIRQLTDYLNQLTEILVWAFNNIEEKKKEIVKNE